MTSKKAVFFHVDMDAFFASVEQRDNPSFRGKPVIVGARPGTRGVVSAASYEARSYGVHSAMPISEAVRRCPGAVFAVPRFSAYSHASEEIMNTLAEFSPRVDQVSVDEAFLDMTGTQRLWGEPLATAQKIKKRIWDTQHLTASIGIAPNKFLSKLASDINKPDGITITPFCHDAIKSWLAPLPVKSMWGVGKKSETALGFLGVYTIGDLQQLGRNLLQTRFGASGAALYDLARGIDNRGFGNAGEQKSISREHTFHQDETDCNVWLKTLLSLACDVARRARKHAMKGSTLLLTYRTPDFQRSTRRLPLPRPTFLADEIFRYAADLLQREKIPGNSLRLLGVGLSDFSRPEQLDLFTDDHHRRVLEASEMAGDDVVERFGKTALFRGNENLHLRKKG